MTVYVCLSDTYYVHLTTKSHYKYFHFCKEEKNKNNMNKNKYVYLFTLLVQTFCCHQFILNCLASCSSISLNIKAEIEKRKQILEI